LKLRRGQQGTTATNPEQIEPRPASTEVKEQPERKKRLEVTNKSFFDSDSDDSSYAPPKKDAAPPPAAYPAPAKKAAFVDSDSDSSECARPTAKKAAFVDADSDSSDSSSDDEGAPIRHCTAFQSLPSMFPYHADADHARGGGR